MAHYKLGRRPSPERKRKQTLKLRDYLMVPGGPDHPPAVDYSTGIASWPMLANDRLGDCTAAGAGHAEQEFAHQAGDTFVPTDADTIKFYELQGYIPGAPSTDRGANMLAVLAAWRKQGFAGRKLIAYAEVDVQNAEFEQGLYLFGSLYCGVNLPQSAMDQFGAGEVWDVARNDGGIIGGHCILAVAYDHAGVTFVTWGKLQRATWAWVEKYCDEAYAAVSRDYDRLHGKPLLSGFNEQQLLADLKDIDLHGEVRGSSLGALVRLVLLFRRWWRA